MTDLPRLHFSRAEYAARLDKAKQAIRKSRYDAVLLFKSEDMYWLTGLDTDGYYVFHTMLVTADGGVTYLGRQADYNNVLYSSIIGDHRTFDELAGSSRGAAIKTLLSDRGLAGKRVGIQYNTMGHRADLYVEIVSSLTDFCTFDDASAMIDRWRLVKSEAEIEKMRQSANIVHLMTDAAIRETRAGVFEGKIFSALAQAIYENDGDPCALRYPIGCGPASKLGRYTSGRNYVADTDQFMFEIGCGYRHYHTAVYFHVLTGDVPKQRLSDLLKKVEEAREAGMAQMRPGNTVGAIHTAISDTYRKYGLDAYLRKSYGYQMGICYPPTWVAAPMVISGSEEVIEENMTIFIHPSLTDTESGLRVSSGETARVLKNGVEKLTSAPAELILN
ncbi:aminopeptidase P family protein [Mesorhizobium sp. CGMCC 1.15528]|uniref:Aminopeptidase P family protein n=1 Tax=Mesorhizobium zhangyense TaxID=1776730 RepID=A0A7C9RCK8_9HYPH|nr:Xaa-Pro peptidase family protein [Mesorhizobium zhangyense]NGN45139.1 aminopeptidase P family protein [Mesorhizobium zhangyense]